MTEIAYQEPVTPAALRYVNRLSDLLFVLARVENDEGRGDVLWRPGADAPTTGEAPRGNAARPLMASRCSGSSGRRRPALDRHDLGRGALPA
jgi:Cobalamin adenosyltransferase